MGVKPGSNASCISTLNIFERKILRRIYGPIKDMGEWRIKNNEDLYGSPILLEKLKYHR